MAAYARRDIRGGAAQTTISAGISNSDTSFAIAASTGWPDGSVGNFYVVLDPGLATEEKIECSTRSGLTINIVTRGADGTSASAHSSAAAVYPCVAKIDLDEANLAVNKTIGQATAAGQILVVDAANSFAAVQAKTSGQILVGNGTTVASVAVSGDATLASTGALTIANSAVTSAKILDAAVTNAKAAGMTRGTLKVGNASGVASDLAVGTASQFLGTDGTDPSWRSLSGDATLSAGALTIANLAVTNAKLAGMTRGTLKVGNSGGAASDLALGTSAKILQSDGTDAKWNAISGDVTIDNTGAVSIGAAKVTATMLASAIAGNGLAGGAGAALSVNVDSATLEIVGDTLQTRNPPLYSARGYSSSNRSVTGNNSYQAILLNAKTYDYNSNFDTAAGTYTIPVTGEYHIDASASMVIANTTAQRGVIGVFQDGTERLRGTDITIRGGTVSDIVGLTLSGDYPFTVGQVLTLRFFGATDDGGAFTVAGGQTLCYMNVRKV